MPTIPIVMATAAAILADPPPITSRWANPRKNWVSLLRNVGWPQREFVVALPQTEHRTGSALGAAAGDRPQPVICVPEPWLRELARRLGMPWQDACRRTVDADA